MNNRRFTRATSLLLSVFVAFGMMAVFVEKPEAKSSRYQVYCQTPLHEGESGYIGAYDSKTYKALKTVSLKSDNTNVVKIKKQTWYDEKNKKHTERYPVAVKPGKAKVTLTYKLPSGKKKTKTKTIKVRAYPNQIESLKVGGKTVKISGKKRYEYSAENKKNSVLIQMKLKEGWKIDSAYGYCYTKSGKEKKISKVKKAIKNGTEISFPKGCKTMSINVYMTNGNDSISYDFYLYR